MLNINTNLSSHLAQSNFNKSTSALNQAIERLSTGYKINHASDNAANYAISNNYSSRLSSYNVASDNIACGMDLIATAQDTLSLMQSHANRLHSLITQARNGTYGASSLTSMNAEAAAIVSEINRLYNTAEYNGIRLFGPSSYEPETDYPDWYYELNRKLDTSKNNGFVEKANNTSQSYIDGLKHVSELTTDFDRNSAYQISTKEDLLKLAELVNNGKSSTGKTFYLGADIDLEGETFTPIGNRSANNSYLFKGTFDGNGHVIKNLSINNSNRQYQGLFGCISANAIVKNLGIENANVKGGNYTGILAGSSEGTIQNCYANGAVEGRERVGGLVGNSTKDIDSTYSVSTVKATKYGAGIVGFTTKGVSNSFTKGSVTTTGDYAGGLAGSIDGIVENCYSTANVKGVNIVSALAARAADAIINSYSTGDAEGYEFVGGVAGIVKKTSGDLNLNKILSTGHITAVQKSGSLIGGIENTSDKREPYSYANITISNAYVVEQELNKVGGAYTTASGNAPVPYDLTDWLNSIEYLQSKEQPVAREISLQVGINNNASSAISLDTTLDYDLSYILENGVQGDDAYNVLDDFLNKLSVRATSFGSTFNRLESALDSVHTDIMNVTSSLSTVKDADIAKVSSQYIQKQILQQAAATLLATANQAPNIALQLI